MTNSLELELKYNKKQLAAKCERLAAKMNHWYREWKAVDGEVQNLVGTLRSKDEHIEYLESEKAELEAKAEDLEAELIFENNTIKMQKKLVQQLEAEKAQQQDRIATLREGLNQAIELLVTALHEPEQITEGEIHDLRTMEIEAREPTPHPAESDNNNG